MKRMDLLLSAPWGSFPGSYGSGKPFGACSVPADGAEHESSLLNFASNPGYNHLRVPGGEVVKFCPSRLRFGSHLAREQRMQR